MKEITKQRIFFVVMITMFSISMIGQAFAVATITLVPTNGPVGTIDNVTGTGFTNSGNITIIHNFNSGQFPNTINNVHAQEFTGLPSNTSLLLEPALNITKTGLCSSCSVASDLTTHANMRSPSSGSSLFGDIGLQEFTGLQPGSVINNLTFNVTAIGPGGAMIALIYDDNGSAGAPDNLLGSSNSDLLNFTGLNYIPLPVGTIHVPSDGKVWGAWESSNTNTHLAGNTSGTFYGLYFQTLTYGTKPNPIGAVSTSTGGFFMALNYTINFSDIRAKIYDDTGSSGSPGTLLGQTGADSISGTGIEHFPILATVPSDGKVWAAFEGDNKFLTMPGTSGSVNQYSVAHTFGPGPNTFSGSPESGASWLGLEYSITNPLSFTWDGQPLSYSPANTSPNSTGGFSKLLFNVPPSFAGTHTVTVKDSFGVNASKFFTLTLPTVSTSITGSTQFGTSNIVPIADYNGSPSTLTVTQEELFKNGSLIQTITSPSVIVPTAVHTIINNVGELMSSSALYQVITTLTDGYNFFNSTSNTIIIQNPNSPGPSQGKQCSVDSCPSQTLVNYTVHRTPDFKTLKMTVNLQPIPFHTECNIVNGTFGNAHKWFNYTSVTFVNFTTHVPYSQNVYFACYGSGPILSGVSPGNGTLIVQGANTFNQTLGVTLGVPIGTFFIAMLGSLANQRTGPIYVVVLLAAVGIMAAVLFFTIPSGAWALELITGFLGIFVGRKIF